MLVLFSGTHAHFQPTIGIGSPNTSTGDFNSLFQSDFVQKEHGLLYLVESLASYASVVWSRSDVAPLGRRYLYRTQ